MNVSLHECVYWRSRMVLPFLYHKRIGIVVQEKTTASKRKNYKRCVSNVVE